MTIYELTNRPRKQPLSRLLKIRIFSDNPIIFLAFIVGLSISQIYLFAIFDLFWSRLLKWFLVFVLMFCWLHLFLPLIFNRRLSLKPVKYFLPLILIVSLKYFSFFVEDPSVFLPDAPALQSQIVGVNYAEIPVGVYFTQTKKFLLNFLVMSVMALGLRSIKSIKMASLVLGSGCALAIIIPLVFFYDTIGSREAVYFGIAFAGGIWNSGIIALMSSGWLLIGIATDIKIPRLIRRAATIMVIVIIFGCIAGLSRSAILAISVSALFYLAYSRNIKNAGKLLFVFSFVFAIVILYWPGVIPGYQDRLIHSTGLLKDASRLLIWEEYIKTAHKYFLFGAPINGYIQFSGYTGRPPHSVILYLLVQFGVFGLGAFLWLLIGLFRSAKNVSRYVSKNQSHILLAWMVCYLTVSMINQTGFMELPLYGAIGIILAWGNVALKQKAIGIVNKRMQWEKDLGKLVY